MPADGPALCDALAHARRYARRLARRLPPGLPCDADDLYQAAALALVRSARRYDPADGSGASFGTFTLRRLRGAMIDHLREIDHLNRKHRLRVGYRGPRLGPLAGREPAGRGPSLPDEAHRRDPGGWAGDLTALVRRLPRRERLLLALCYRDGLTLTAAGARLGVSVTRASQIRTAALRRLRRFAGA